MSTTTDSNPPPDTSTALTFSEGQILAGCYALTRRLSTGAGPEVWLATDEVLGKDVTLHFLPPAVVADPRALQELRQDVKRVRQLIHPNILRVYDLIEESGWAAISMSAFEAESVAAKRARQGTFVAAEIEPWVYQLVQTVDDAHKINVLHRDLAPENIYLTGAGQVLVADFGISRTVQDALVRAGAADPARVAYCSPQTLEAAVPARTDDVYSLGAVLYTLLAGTPPVAGGDVSALEKSELNVPPAWKSTIASSLQKAAEARPPTAGEFLRLLKEVGDVPATIPAPKELPADIPPPVIQPPVQPVPPPADQVETVQMPMPVVEKPKSKRNFLAPEKKPEVIQLEPVTEPIELEPAGKVLESKVVEPKPEPKPEPKRLEPEKKPAPLARVEPQKPPARPTTGDFKPKLYPEEPKLPVVWIAAAVGAVVLFAIVYHFMGGKKEGGQEVASPTPEKTELKDLSQTPAPPTVVTKPAATPAGPTPEQVAAQAAVAEAEKTVADKQAALETAKQAAQAAEKTQADLAQQQQTADAAVADVQKTVADKTKASDAAKSAVDDAAAQQKKLADDEKAAEAAVIEAQKALADKTKLVEDNKKSLTDLAKKNDESVAAQQKANADLKAAQKTLADKQKAAADAAKAAADAEATHQQKAAAVTDLEKALDAAKAALADNQKKLGITGSAEASQTGTAPAKMLEDFKDKMAQIKSAPATATPAVKPPPASTPAAKPQVGVAPSTPAPAPAVTPEAITLTLNTTPVPTMQFPKPDKGPANSLGQKFAPVGDVDFCIWLTRVKDFAVFAKAVNLKSNSWQQPGFVQAPDHPVVNVTWIEAIAFCKWLTDTEHKEGSLPANQFYRLPTDLEWSKAVGLPEETGKTPEARDMGVPEVYPWGTGWPPPPGAGNYTGEETGSDVAIKGYDDGFAWTSPVGSFKPNKYGLYDMGGNVWQWCMDNWNAESKAKVLRGASWYNGALKLSLLSSCRVHAAPDSSTDNYGFRVVRATDTTKVVKKPELR